MFNTPDQFKGFLVIRYHLLKMQDGIVQVTGCNLRRVISPNRGSRSLIRFDKIQIEM
jgi:hypothetical protein